MRIFRVGASGQAISNGALTGGRLVNAVVRPDGAVCHKRKERSNETEKEDQYVKVLKFTEV